jgi:hypothetical protein
MISKTQGPTVTIPLAPAVGIYFFHGIIEYQRALTTNEARSNRSLNRDAAFHRAIQRLDAVTSQFALGVLHHHNYTNKKFTTHRNVVQRSSAKT